MKKIGFILFLFMSVGLASAQVPTSGNVFFGYSYYNTDLSSYNSGDSSSDRANTNGWEASVEGKVIPFLGLVADVDSHYGSQNFPAVCALGGVGCTINANITEHNFLFGPRVSMSVGKFRPFAEALFGGAHVNAGVAGSDTSFATALGGGTRLQNHPSDCVAFAGRLRADPLLRGDAEQRAFVDGNCVAILGIAQNARIRIQLVG
jgi:hypothetical protein